MSAEYILPSIDAFQRQITPIIGDLRNIFNNPNQRSLLGRVASRISGQKTSLIRQLDTIHENIKRKTNIEINNEFTSENRILQMYFLIYGYKLKLEEFRNNPMVYDDNQRAEFVRILDININKYLVLNAEVYNKLNSIYPRIVIDHRFFGEGSRSENAARRILEQIVLIPRGLQEPSPVNPAPVADVQREAGEQSDRAERAAIATQENTDTVRAYRSPFSSTEREQSQSRILERMRTLLSQQQPPLSSIHQERILESAQTRLSQQRGNRDPLSPIQQEHMLERWRTLLSQQRGNRDPLSPIQQEQVQSGIFESENMQGMQLQHLGNNSYAFKAIPNSSQQLLEERTVIHPNYFIINQLERLEIVKGYLECCNLLHGYDTSSYTLRQNPHNTPRDQGETIDVSKQMKSEESYKGIVEFLAFKGNKIKQPYVKPDGPGCDAGGISRDFSNAVGNYIKEKYMTHVVVPKVLSIESESLTSNSQAGGAAAAAENIRRNAATGNSRANSNASNSEKKIDIDLSPMDFNLSETTTEEEIQNLASVLGYYAFVVPKLSDKGLNLGINFSAFALIVLFNDDIITKLTTILTRLRHFETTTNSDGKQRVDEYFQLDLPYDAESITRKQEFKDTDKEIEYLIGLFYAIDELYYPDDFTRDIKNQIDSKIYNSPFEELISLVSKYTHSSRDNFKSQANSEGYKIYDNEIQSLLSKLENLGLLGSLFRNAYNDAFGKDTYNLTVNASNQPIPNVDLFSLGQCISQNENITAKAISKIIDYHNYSTDYHLTMVKNAINGFLDKHNKNTQMLFRFIKYITGSLSLPSKIEINVMNNYNMRIKAQTCSFILNVGSHPDVSTIDSLVKFLEGHILYDTGFGIAGGSRKTRNRSRKQHRKQSHNQFRKRIQKHNKNKIGKRTCNNNKRATKKHS
jgi:hypothetical protein